MTAKFQAVARYLSTSPVKVVASFDDEDAARAYVERAKERYFEVWMVVA